jgi:hypothetical protein
MLITLQKMPQDFAQKVSTRTKAFPDAIGAFPSRQQLRVTTLGQFFGPITETMEALALVKSVARDIREMAYCRPATI